ncbi:3-oxo-tetronate kinase [Naasia aerilata]|uniref:3-oxo-tetronate kinase n=1 Tax=Naasia aerilata TaxID=1162966 RepID=A0ABM8GBS4_9MICO|nr:3-oxo-tetronate kinase [Naasia aerilata]BDZ45691.1 HPr kinase [Naasia aerilata]
MSRLGVIADDVTGACDVAGGVAAAGVRTSVYLGVPGADATDDAADECLVVALKTRTVPAEQAVAESAEAARWLRAHGATRLYQKYCSTFDSTDRGNIGPVADALAPVDGISVGTPATPAAGRTQYLGHLFVGDRLLSESSMRDHPLTPMRDSDLVAVLSRQTSSRVELVPLPTVRSGATELAAELDRRAGAGARHLLVDAIADSDLDALAAALDRVQTPLVLGGGAGIALALARRTGHGSGVAAEAVPPGGPRLILSGSASLRTREQVAAFDGPVVAVDPLAIDREGTAPVLAAVRAALSASGDTPVLVSATVGPERVRDAQQRLGAERAAGLLESALASAGLLGVAELGVRRLIVAGGETSGAAVAALGLRRLAVGRLAAPGVPWTTGAAAAVGGSPTVALLLKSGNFGEPDLFTRAWESAP